VKSFSKLLPLLALAIIAGCGDDAKDTLTKAQVIERGTKICKAAERKAQRLPQPKSDDPFAKGSSAAERQAGVAFLTGYADALETTRTGLSELDAPAQDRELLDGYIGDLEDIVSLLRAAAKEENVDKAMEAFERFEKASSQTANYGFAPGVCGAGNS